MGSMPKASIFAFDSAENFGLRAAVGNSRSLVGFSSGFSPAAEKILPAHLYQEIGSPPPM